MSMASESDVSEIKLAAGEGEEHRDTPIVKMRLTVGRSRKARYLALLAAYSFCGSCGKILPSA